MKGKCRFTLRAQRFFAKNRKDFYLNFSAFFAMYFLSGLCVNLYYFLYLQNMKAARIGIDILFTLFLLICIGVHVVGLATHYSDEPVYSHCIHLLSYCLCLYALLRKGIPYRALIYFLAAVYPFLYHGNCAWMSYTLHGRLNPVCILVVVLMPLIGFWIWRQGSNLPGKR